jgi:hypothetical protein
VLSRAEINDLAFGMRKGTPEYVPMHERLQAAQALRERPHGVPFDAKTAAAAATRGDEMAYGCNGKPRRRRPPAAGVAQGPRRGLANTVPAAQGRLRQMRHHKIGRAQAIDRPLAVLRPRHASEGLWPKQADAAHAVSAAATRAVCAGGRVRPPVTGVPTAA